MMSPVVEDLSRRLDERLAAEAEALAELEALHRSRTAVLMTGNDRVLSEHDAKASTAQTKLERAQLWIAKLQDELAEAKAREAEAPKQAAYDLAKRKAAAMTKRVAEEYPEAAGKLAALMSDLRAVNAEVAAVNQALPAGAARIPSTEMELRFKPAEPRKIIDEKEVVVWVSEYRSVDEEGKLGRGCLCDPEVDIEQAASIRPIGGGQGRTDTGFARCWTLCLARKVTVRDAAHAIDMHPLHESVHLPGLRPGDPPIWESVPEEMVGGMTLRAFTWRGPPAEHVEYYYIGEIDEDAEDSANEEVAA